MSDSSNGRNRDVADGLIVGGGAAGCVLADRLSEDPLLRLLLLEAGPDYARTRDVPADLRDADEFPHSHDWGFQSEPGILGRAAIPGDWAHKSPVCPIDPRGPRLQSGDASTRSLDAGVLAAAQVPNRRPTTLAAGHPPESSRSSASAPRARACARDQS